MSKRLARTLFSVEKNRYSILSSLVLAIIVVEIVFFECCFVEIRSLERIDSCLYCIHLFPFYNY